MQEYIITINRNGKRETHRQFGYHVSDAKKRLKEAVGTFTTVSSKKA